MDTKERAAYIAALDALPKDEIKAALKQALADAEASVEKACICLARLDPLDAAQIVAKLPSPYDHYQAIADGALSAHAAWMCCTRPGALDALTGLPSDLQDRLADGLKVPVAARQDGRIVKLDLDILGMTPAQMKLALDAESETGLVPIGEQQRWMHENNVSDLGLARAKAAAKVKVKADPEKGVVLVNRTPVSLDDLRVAVAALGYEFKPIYGASGIKARVAN